MLGTGTVGLSSPCGIRYEVCVILWCQVGDRVMVVNNFGVWQETLVIASAHCVPIPDTMSFEDAAAIPINYITAAVMLFDQAALKPGDSVFVHMAAGMVV